MMAIQKEYVCMAHGDFDATEPKCPHGCAGDLMVQRVFRTAPTIRSASFGNINRTFESLAAEHGLSNMNNSGGGGMRRADYDAHRRLNQATQLLVQGGDRGGMDVSDVFKPIGNFQPGSTGDGGALRKVDGHTVNSAGIPLNMPAPRLEARPFDGKSLGLPQGD